MTIIYILLSIIIIYFIICYVAFDTAVVRHKEITNFDDETIRKSKVYSPSADFVINGRRWFETMDFEAVNIPSKDGLLLKGRYIANEKNRGTLILCHGYRSEAINDMGGSASFYYEMGFNLLFIDQRSHQGSQGKYITYGVLEKNDVLEWVSWVLDRNGADAKIALAGISMGAATVLMALGYEHRDNIKCAVADCGFTSPWNIIASVSKSYYHIPFAPFGPGINLLCKMLAGYSLKECSTVQALQNTKVPILFIHGTADDFVPCQMTLEAYRSYNGPKSLLLVDDAAHGQSFVMDPEAYKKALKELFDRYI